MILVNARTKNPIYQTVKFYITCLFISNAASQNVHIQSLMALQYYNASVTEELHI